MFTDKTWAILYEAKKILGIEEAGCESGFTFNELCYVRTGNESEILVESANMDLIKGGPKTDNHANR